jgi:hypothetical protein
MKLIFKALKGFFKSICRYIWHVKARYARMVPDGSYFVAFDGSVRRKFPKLAISKKQRRLMRAPAKVTRYIAESQIALDWAKKTVERKQAALMELRNGIISRGMPFAEITRRLDEAIA